MNPKVTKKVSVFEEFIRRLKKLAPVNIILGTVASFFVIWMRGIENYIYLILSAIVWITLISTFVSTISKVNKK